jgi:hypothetical protein
MKIAKGGSEKSVKKIMSIFIGFVHDFAAGCWAATVLGVYWLSRQTATTDVGVVLFGLKKQLFYLGIVCVFLVFATGAGRTFTYVGNVYGEDAEKIRRKMLIVKHIFLLAVFGAGTYWQFVMIFR